VRVFRAIPQSPDMPVALCIGNFDGIHLGHQAMLKRMREAAREYGLPASVLTFEPHPREFFSPQEAPPRLSSLREKLELLRAFGVAVSTARSRKPTRPTSFRACWFDACKFAGCWWAAIFASARNAAAIMRCCRAKLRRVISRSKRSRA
jgi:cytidyltransferase-like protein